MPEPQGRQDPKPRHVIGSKEAKVLGKRPDRHYVLAHNAGSGGLDDYLEAGYEIERYASKPGDGCRIAGVKGKPGESITFRGHTLVSISLEAAKALIEEQQREADEIEKQIIKQRRGVDQLRGLGVVRQGYLSLEQGGVDFSA